MKNSAPETTGYEYFKKQNGRVLKKIPLIIIRKTLRHCKVLILLNILVLRLAISNKLFDIIDKILTLIMNRTFQSLQNAKRK